MTEERIKKIPGDLSEGVVYIIQEFRNFTEQHNFNDFISNHDMFEEILGYYYVFTEFLKSHDYSFVPLEIDDNAGMFEDVVQSIFTFFNNHEESFRNQKRKEIIEASKEKYKGIFQNTFSYEFSKEDQKRIQELINYLRDDITVCGLFEEEHKQRILKRLEKLQSELHKKVSDLDRFWGLIGDAGVVIGKFGNDVKPIVDRIREMMDIVWRTQSKTEGLPEGGSIPFLSERSTEN